MYIHVIGQIVTILWTTQLYHMSMLMFIPIAGRSGGGSNPDLMIGHNSAALTVLITSYLVSLIPGFDYIFNPFATVTEFYIFSS